MCLWSKRNPSFLTFILSECYLSVSSANAIKVIHFKQERYTFLCVIWSDLLQPGLRRGIIIFPGSGWFVTFIEVCELTNLGLPLLLCKQPTEKMAGLQRENNLVIFPSSNQDTNVSLNFILGILSCQRFSLCSERLWAEVPVKLLSVCSNCWQILWLQ